MGDLPLAPRLTAQPPELGSRILGAHPLRATLRSGGRDQARRPPDRADVSFARRPMTSSGASTSASPATASSAARTSTSATAYSATARRSSSTRGRSPTSTTTSTRPNTCDGRARPAARSGSSSPSTRSWPSDSRRPAPASPRRRSRLAAGPFAAPAAGVQLAAAARRRRARAQRPQHRPPAPRSSSPCARSNICAARRAARVAPLSGSAARPRLPRDRGPRAAIRSSPQYGSPAANLPPSSTMLAARGAPIRRPRRSCSTAVEGRAPAAAEGAAGHLRRRLRRPPADGAPDPRAARNPGRRLRRRRPDRRHATSGTATSARASCRCSTPRACAPLAEAGIEIGSHGASHRPLLAEVARGSRWRRSCAIPPTSSRRPACRARAPSPIPTASGAPAIADGGAATPATPPPSRSTAASSAPGSDRYALPRIEVLAGDSPRRCGSSSRRRGGRPLRGAGFCGLLACGS